MKHPTPDYPFVAMQEALRSLTGAGFAMLVVCMLGGSIPTAATWTSLPTVEDWILLAFGWMGHWIMAGVMLWGLLVVLAPIWCLYELLHGSRNPLLVLVALLITQLLVSTVAVCTFAGGEERMHPIIASSMVTLFAIIVTLWATRVAARRAAAQPGGPGGANQPIRAEICSTSSAACSRRWPLRYTS
jgi:hypothetical protein